MRKAEKNERREERCARREATDPAADVEPSDAGGLPCATAGAPLRTLSELTAGVAAPREPKNPLNEAYNLRAYDEMSKRRRSRRSPPRSQADELPEWDHRGFEFRSPSPCRLRTDGAHANTRREAWRSRAGGVYLPPEEGVREIRASISPEPAARYLYPEDFKRKENMRRSPSYNPEPRAKSSSSSSASSWSERQRARRKRKAARKAAREARKSSCSSSSSSRSQRKRKAARKARKRSRSRSAQGRRKRSPTPPQEERRPTT